MELKLNQVVLHLLDPGASEPVLSDRAMDMDADLYEYYTGLCRRNGAEQRFHRPVPPHCGRDF